MKPDLFERHLSQQPWRPVPPSWREEILARTDLSRVDVSTDLPPPGSLRHRISGWLWPHPFAWAGLAACWAAVLLLNQMTAPSAADLARAREGARIAHIGLAALRSHVALELTGVPAVAPAPERPRRGRTDQGWIPTAPAWCVA